MSIFRNLLKNNSSSYIRFLQDSLNYASEGETKTLTVESNDTWTLTVTYKEE